MKFKNHAGKEINLPNPHWGIVIPPRIAILKGVIVTRRERMKEKIIPLLLNAAENRSSVSFKLLYQEAGVDGDAARSECHRALEDAADSLQDFRIANYVSLMAKKDTGCPGDGFFDTFYTHRRDEYVGLVGEVLTLDLTVEQQKTLTFAERERVYVDTA